jgi:DNA (cytosine-5)-methyltransferase 3A
MNILSLFDGISCGQVALRNSGISIDNYFASEIDKNSILITQKNFPKTIQIGDIKNVRGSDLPKIDLLIGGSPCQGFSFAGKRLNFEDERSKLFFEYVRLLDECKPTYFLLENVKMKKEYEEIITSYLKVKPIEINSALVSAQNRKRLYWTNINILEKPKDKGILLKEVLEDNVEEKYILENKLNKNQLNKINEFDVKIDKSGCLTEAQGRAGSSSEYLKMVKKIYLLKGILRRITPIECERLQNLPDNYTSGINMTSRYKALGNCWTIDIISHIFSYI